MVVLSQRRQRNRLRTRTLFVSGKLADLLEAEITSFLYVLRSNFVDVEQAGVKVAHGDAGEAIVSAGRGKHLYAIVRECLAHSFPRNIDRTALPRAAIFEDLHGVR